MPYYFYGFERRSSRMHLYGMHEIHTRWSIIKLNKLRSLPKPTECDDLDEGWKIDDIAILLRTKYDWIFLFHSIFKIWTLLILPVTLWCT